MIGFGQRYLYLRIGVVIHVVPYRHTERGQKRQRVWVESAVAGEKL